MYKAALYLALAGLAAAQETPDLFTKAPPAVDEALRARITQFYQAHVEGKYRAAESVVAEDTKDFFYASNKPKYLSFEIVRIQYSQEFTRAKATVLCEQFVLMPGFTDKPMKVPTPSSWKLENGQWYWWVDPVELRKTPFGERKADPGKPGEGGGKLSIPTPADMRFIFSQVRADKPKVEIADGAQVEVKFTNGAAGTVKLVLPSVMMGFEASFDKTELKANESAVLKLKRPAGAKVRAGAIEVRVDPTNQVIPIQVELLGAAPAKEIAAVSRLAEETAMLYADRERVALKKGGSAEVKFTNGTKQVLKLALPSKRLGLQATLDKTELKAGESAVLVLKRPATGKATAGAFQVKSQPGGKVITVKVTLE